jgi:hypothetical protein
MMPSSTSIINHVIAETLTTGRMIPSSTSIINHVIAETLTWHDLLYW